MYHLHLLTASFLGGLSVRISTLPFSIFADRAVVRVAHAMVDIRVAYQKFADVADNARSTRPEVDWARETLGKRRRAIMRQYHTSNLKATLPTLLAGGATLLLGGQLLFALSRLAARCSGPPRGPESLSGDGVQMGAPGGTAYSPTRSGWDAQTTGGLIAAFASGALLATMNVDASLSRRLGFTARKDLLIHHLRLTTRVVAAFATLGYAGACSHLAATGTASWAVLGLAPCAVWAAPALLCGVACAGTLQTAVFRNPSARRLLGFPSTWPELHGWYNNDCVENPTQLLSRRHKAFSEGSEGKSAVERYIDVKRQIEHDCEVRLDQQPWRAWFKDSRFAATPSSSSGSSGDARTGRHNPSVSASMKSEEQQRNLDDAASATGGRGYITSK